MINFCNIRYYKNGFTCHKEKCIPDYVIIQPNSMVYQFYFSINNIKF